MPTLSQNLLASGSQAGGSTLTISSLTLPQNTGDIIAVGIYNSTPANLCDPTISGWDAIANVTPSVGSIVRRLKVFRRMASADVVGTIPIVGNGVAQTSWRWALVGAGGVETGGSNGVDAVVQVVTGDSGSSNVTSLPLTLAAFAGPNNGALAFFWGSVNSSIAPRSGWTEVDDNGTTTFGRIEVQFIASEDTTADCVMSSGLALGVAIELQAVTDPIIPSKTELSLTGSGALRSAVDVAVRAGRAVFLVVGCNNDTGASPTTCTPTLPGVTWTPLFAERFSNGTDSHAAFGGVWVTTVEHDVVGPLAITFASSALNVAAAIVEVADIDTTVGGGTGIVQSNDVVGNGASTVVLSTFGSRNHGALVVGVTAGTDPSTPENGWQQLLSLRNNVTYCYAAWRANADESPKVTAPGHCMFAAFELVGSGDCPCAVTDDVPPVIGDPTPADGSTIEPDGTISFNVTDDIELADVHVHVLKPSSADDNIHDGGDDFALQYDAASTRSGNSVDGYDFVLARDGAGWDEESITIRVIATDTHGNKSTAEWTFPVNLPPVAGPIAQAPASPLGLGRGGIGFILD